MNASTTAPKLLVGIDIAKRYHDVIIQWPTGRVRAFKVANTRHELDRLVSYLHEQHLPVMAALEPTGDYHRAIAYALAQAQFEVRLASSLACARVREALFNSWDKNDRKDARVILHLLAQGMTEPFHEPLRSGYLDLQELSNTYHQIALARSRCLHSLLNHYLVLFFPEMERYLHSSRSEWLCRYLIRFPTPAAVRALSLEAFTEAAWDLVGRKVAKRRLLAELYTTAEHSVALPVAEDSIAIETFRLQLRRYAELTDQRKQLELRAGEVLGNHPDSCRLQTLPGVGPIIALSILAESGDLRRFRHHRQYLKFCGFNLSALQSGQRTGGPKISKRGNARLRYVYWLAATVAIRQRENSFRAAFRRYVSQNPDNKDLQRKARTAVAVKMARVAHALIKRGTDYRGYHEAAIPGGGTPLTGP